MKRSRKYLKGMMKAIDKARENYNGIDCTFNSKTDGLRAIRRFESVNNIDFDPSNPTHISKITGNGRHERFFRLSSYI